MLWLVPVWILIGLAIYPLTVLGTLADAGGSLGKFGRMLWTSRDLPPKYHDLVMDTYQAAIFTPNIIGAVGSIASQFYSSLSINQGDVLSLLYSNLALLVVSSTGLGLLKIANQRVGLVFLGEWVCTWAFVSGALLFVSLLVLLAGTVGWFLVAVMSATILFFVGLVMYFVVAEGVATYVAKATPEAGKK